MADVQPDLRAGGYAPGDYYCTCVDCGSTTQADKRAVRCASCAKMVMRIADLEASMRHAAKIEAALRGIINHWYEFAEMMIENKTDYGLGERIDAASKLIKQ